mgnify:CR=1 FL=1
MAGSKEIGEQEVWLQRGGGRDPTATSTNSINSTTSTTSTSTSPQVLSSWADAYLALARDAERLGIPRSAIPPLPPAVDAERLRRARENLELMIQSFLSSGL